MRELRERKVYRLQAFFSPHFRWTYRTKTFVRVNKFQVSDEKIFRTNKLQKSTTRTVTFCVRSTSKYSFYTIYNIYGYVQAQYLSSYVLFYGENIDAKLLFHFTGYCLHMWLHRDHIDGVGFGLHRLADGSRFPRRTLSTLHRRWRYSTAAIQSGRSTRLLR